MIESPGASMRLDDINIWVTAHFGPPSHDSKLFLDHVEEMGQFWVA